MRMSPTELVAHHEPGLSIEGTRVTLTFGDQGVARAFFDGIFAAGERRSVPDDPFRMTGKRLEALSLQLGQPLEGWADLFLRDGDGQGHHFILDPGDLGAVADSVRGSRSATVDEARENDVLHLRIKHLEQEVARLREPVGRSDLRDMGATLVDKARARLLEARAENLELENAALRRPSDDQPFQTDRWAVASDGVNRTVTAIACDLQGRKVRIETPPDRARWLAEHLLSAARHVEAFRGDHAHAEDVRRRCEAAERLAQEI